MTELLDTFISEHLGFKFIEPLTFDLGRILADTGPKLPLIFLLDPSKDPLKMSIRMYKSIEIYPPHYIFPQP